MYLPQIGQRVIVNRVRKGVVVGLATLRAQPVVYVEWDALHPVTGHAWRDTVPAEQITRITLLGADT